MDDECKELHRFMGKIKTFWLEDYRKRCSKYWGTPVEDVVREELKENEAKFDRIREILSA
jgi:hypothetical protein